MPCLLRGKGQSHCSLAAKGRAGGRWAGEDKAGSLWDKLGRIDLKEDTAQAVEAEENFLMKHSFQKDKVGSDTAKLIFMALKTIFEKTFAEGRLRYEVGVFLSGCKYLVLLSEFLIHFEKNKFFWESFVQLKNSLKEVGLKKKFAVFAR